MLLLQVFMPSVFVHTQRMPEMLPEAKAIYEYASEYRGSRLDEGYISTLSAECNDLEALRLVVAVSVAESGMGRDTKKNSNF